MQFSLRCRALELVKDDCPEEARRLLIEWCKTSPEDAEAWQMLSTLHGMLGATEESRACACRAIDLQPACGAAHVNLGNVHLAEGQVDEAIRNYQRAIDIDPTLTNAYCNLSNLLIAQERYAEATDYCQRAVRLQPDAVNLNALKRQATSLLSNGRLDEARTVFSELCKASPADADLWYLLSCAEGRLGNLDRSAVCCQRAITLRPDHAKAHVNLGNVRASQGHPDDAVGHYRAALSLDGNLAMAHYNLGNALSALARYDEAAASYRDAIALRPNFEEAYFSLGNIQRAQGLLEDAVNNFRMTIQLNEAYAPAYNHLGAALYDLGFGKLAIETLLKAIALRPDDATAYYILGTVLQKNSRLQEAKTMLEKALRLDPNLADAYHLLAGTLILQGRPEEGFEMDRKALELQPHSENVHSSMILAMQYLPEYSEQDILEESKIWSLRHTPDRPCLSPVTHAPNRSDSLRIGYVSGDFHDHPVGFFIEAILAAHDRSRFDIYCYYNNNKSDDQNALLRQTADHWRDVAYLSTEDVARTIRDDSIDILIDLSGHTGRSALPAFAHRPAPVQATWLGYFATTGLDAIDYIIADRYVIPRGKEHGYTEEVIRLPDSYLCFSAPRYPIAPSSLPALSKDQIMFGCFHNASKLTQAAIRCWAQILLALPTARLYFKYQAYGDKDVRLRYQDLFSKHGIEPDRLVFAGYSPRHELLQAYHEVDIGLDPFPYCGGTTTVEALWMGIPVITKRGDRFSHCVGESILNTMGLDDLVVDTEHDYIEKTVTLASDLARLAELRQSLRARLMESPLCDGVRFTRNLETAYGTMWEKWLHDHE